MGIPEPRPSKAKVKHAPKSNTPQGKRKRVAYVPPVSRNGLRLLHEKLEAALPVRTSGVTTEAMRNLDLQCWEPGLTTPEFRQRYLDACVLKRWQGGSKEDADSRDEAAYAKLLDSEKRCRETNKLFTGPESLDWSNARIPLHLQKVYKRARRIIAQILGQFDWEEFPTCVDFSSGATTEFPRRSSKVSNKWQHGSHITRRAMPYGEAFRRWSKAPSMDLNNDTRGVRQDWPAFQAWECNDVFTVPKKFDTNRTAAKGTTWNTALQKGVGTMVRRRCQRWVEPLLTPDAQVYHGLLARLGSGTSCLVTGDLVGASDSVTVGHVATFYPDSWQEPLLDLREEYGIMPDGSIVRWEKIGSMGNGYTFEVETVLFYGLVKACCSRDSVVSVYGDDLIYPQQYHELVTEVMAFAGFEFNREKTFSGRHPFRESCGSYFHSGTDVKPFYIEKLPQTLGDVINLHNDVVMWHRSASPDGPWGDVIKQCRALVHSRYWGPLGVSGTLWSEWDEAQPKYQPGIRAWTVLALRAEVIQEEDDALIGRYLSYLWKGTAQALNVYSPDHRERDRGALTGYPLTDYLDRGSEHGYTSKVGTRLVCSKRHVDRVRWVQLTAHNIEQTARALYERI